MPFDGRSYYQPAPNNPVADGFRRAIDLIEKEGWQQGDYSPDKKHRGYCLVGALGQVFDGEPLQLPWKKSKDLKKAYKIMRHVTGRYALWVWNDQKGRTKRDVINALNYGIAHAEGRVLANA